MWDVSILTKPAPVQVHRHKHRRNCEEVHHRVHLQPEPQLVVGSNKLEMKGYGWESWFSGTQIRVQINTLVLNLHVGQSTARRRRWTPCRSAAWSLCRSSDRTRWDCETEGETKCDSVLQILAVEWGKLWIYIKSVSFKKKKLKSCILLFLKMHFKISKEKELRCWKSAIVGIFQWFSVEKGHAFIVTRAITCQDTWLTLK